MDGNPLKNSGSNLSLDTSTPSFSPNKFFVGTQDLLTAPANDAEPVSSSYEACLSPEISTFPSSLLPAKGTIIPFASPDGLGNMGSLEMPSAVRNHDLLTGQEPTIDFDFEKRRKLSESRDIDTSNPLFNVGYREGHKDGYSAGFSEGFSEGFSKGRESTQEVLCPQWKACLRGGGSYYDLRGAHFKGGLADTVQGHQYGKLENF